MRDTRDARRETRKRAASSREVCRVPGCGESTTERKSYCITHVAQNDYANHVQAELAQRAKEEKRIKRGPKAVDVNGSRAREIIEHLTVVGMETPKRLAQSVDMTKTMLGTYLKALERAELITQAEIPSKRSRWVKVVVLGTKTRHLRYSQDSELFRWTPRASTSGESNGSVAPVPQPQAAGHSPLLDR